MARLSPQPTILPKFDSAGVHPDPADAVLLDPEHEVPGSSSYHIRLPQAAASNDRIQRACCADAIRATHRTGPDSVGVSGLFRHTLPDRLRRHGRHVPSHHWPTDACNDARRLLPAMGFCGRDANEEWRERHAGLVQKR